MKPPDVAIAYQIIALLISIGALVFGAGRWLVTKKHLYKDDGTPIYLKADDCVTKRAEELSASIKRHDELAKSMKDMNDTLAMVVTQLTGIDKSHAVLANEVSHLRKDLNGVAK